MASSNSKFVLRIMFPVTACPAEDSVCPGGLSCTPVAVAVAGVIGVKTGGVELEEEG